MNKLLKEFLSRQNKVLNKIFVPFVVVMVLIGALIIYVMTDLVSANVEGRVSERLRNDARLIQESISDMEASLAFYAQFIADTERLAGHISEERDSRLVLIYLLEFLKENQISSDIGGDLSTGSPGLSHLGLLGMRTTGLLVRRRGDKTRLALSAVAPIEGRAGSRSVVTVSREIDREFLSDLRKKTGAERIQIYYRGELIESSSSAEECDKKVREILTTDLMNQTLSADTPYLAEFDCDEHSMKMMVSPLTVNFKKEALVAVLESMDDLARAKRNIIITTVVAVGLMFLIIVPMYIMTVSRTVSPIRELSQASRAVAEGRLDQHVPVRTRDEVGELSESFNTMIDDLKRYREELERWNQTLEQRVAERTRQLAEAQAKLIQSTKLAAVGELAAGIAHELNNPLAGIYAFLQVFAETVRSRGLKELSEGEASSFQENLVHVEREIQRCKSIIGSLLSFARVSDKNFTLVDLNKVARDTLAFMRSNLEKGGIKVETRYAQDLPPVLGDFNELQQVLLNIIVNARKAMPDGGSLVVVTAAESSEHSVRVAVSDSGEGIRPEILDKIFDPFFTTSRPGEGTGLGLSISYGIIRDHNGEILVDSRPGEGSCFSVVLPAADAETADNASVSRISPSEKSRNEASL
jgi:signal transduction histidine kinase